MKHKNLITCLLLTTTYFSFSIGLTAQQSLIPSSKELNQPFGKHDQKAFMAPPKTFHPETWFHYIGGNVATKGITADLEAIVAGGFSGIQLFHGQFGGPWSGVEPQIQCLSPLWEDALHHTAKESSRLGLNFTMQNCPGWAMAGGPWIEPSNAMRHLVYSRTDVTGGTTIVDKVLSKPQPSDESWRDYKDITVLAFPTPLDDTGEPLKPLSVKSNKEIAWEDLLLGKAKGAANFSPTTADNPHWLEITYPSPITIRTIEFPSINSLNHPWAFEPGVTVSATVVTPEGKTKEILNAELPQSGWQDDRPISFACPEVKNITKCRINIVNKHDMSLGSLRLFSGARKNNWESEAGWTLRSIERTGENVKQSPETGINFAQIVDITAMMDAQGNLNWKAPKGNWTILRIGHVNTGMKNGPAPPEGTGWECDKLSLAGSDAQFDNYIGRLSKANGPLGNNLLKQVLFDSWECRTQTWTKDMESEFKRVADYDLRKWLPSVFGYVIEDQETTGRFLHDWRATIGDLFSNKFYGNMAKKAKENNLSITFETAAGDVFPADILEYFKHADVPMCEFWQPFSEGFVGSLNFKPIKPTASAARMYGKPRVAAEAFTSFALTWDEHWDQLKEVANVNSIEGVTHMVFHTYTHNPRTDFLPPGTSFGAGIGTPFLRGQTWWKHIPEFNAYLSRCSYMLERGKPVSDILWYLGDEINHKPDQNTAMPEGFKYDYCNPDVLLNRLSVENGMIVTPEGTSYRVLWLPDVPRMLPETLEKIYSLVSNGATIIGNPPKGLVSLTGGKAAQKRFDDAVKNIWGKTTQEGIRQVGKGKVITAMELPAALKSLDIAPDVTGGDALWTHRKIDGADWYFVCAPKGKEFKGTLDFRNTGSIQLWDPVTGSVNAIAGEQEADRTAVSLDLPRSGSCFVVFNHTSDDNSTLVKQNEEIATIPLTSTWTLSFPSGWDAPSSIQIQTLKAWKDLSISEEGKAFSGTATYNTTFNIDEMKQGMRFNLDLGKVEMIAVVHLNGKPIRTLWAPPYSVDLTDEIKAGQNSLTVEVTSTWFNRLVYDAAQPEDQRKTWVINGPSKDAKLRESGLLGPVVIHVEKEYEVQNLSAK